MNDTLSVRVYYDSESIKDASIWKIALVDKDCHMLYIETLHDKVSDKLPEETYTRLCKESYFKGFTGYDTTLATLNLVNGVNGEGSTDINIFVDEDDKIRAKILDYFRKNFNSDKIIITFKDSFEQVLFMDFIKDTLKDYDLSYMYLDCYVCDPHAEKYNEICESSIQHSLEELKENDEMKSLFVYIRIIIEDLLLKDFFMYLINPTNFEEDYTNGTD